MAEHELNKIVDDDGEVFNLRDSTKQPVADRVTAWGSTPSDTKYPSEKLVKTQQDEIIKKAYGAQGFISSSAANAEIFAERTLMGSWSLNNRNGSVRVQLYRYADGNEDNATLVWDSNTATGDVKESFLNAKQTGTLLTTDPGECAKVVYTGSTSSYFRAIGIYLNVKVADASHTVSANLRIGTTNYPTYSVSTWGSLVTAIASDVTTTSATVLFRPNQSTGQMRFYGFRCLNTYSEGGTLIGTADTSLKLKTSRKLAVSLSNTSTDTSFDGSADVTNIKTTGTLGVGNGGTGATTAIGAEYNILNQVADIDTTINGDRKIALCNQTKSASNGVFRWLKLSNVWTWIKGLLSSESDVNISGNAATATTAAGYTNDGAIATALGNKQDGLGISSSGDAGKYLNEKGQWATPAGTGAKEKSYYQSGSWKGVKFATTTVTSDDATAYGVFQFTRLQIGTGIKTLGGSADKPIVGIVQIFHRTNKNGETVAANVMARITVFQSDFTGEIRVYYQINGTSVDWYIATTTARTFVGWRTLKLFSYGTVNDIDLSGVNDVSALTENNASYKTPLVAAASTGTGSETNPVYVDENGRVQACNFDETCKPISQLSPASTSYDTTTTAINSTHILQATSNSYVINIKRLKVGLAYKFMFLEGSNSGQVYLCNGNGSNFSYSSGPNGGTTKKLSLNGGSHGSSYTSYVIRDSDASVYHIWGY